MHYHKQGYPAEDEILLCTVTNVQYNSVFCNLDEYPGKSGMIHISEVTAGRIRNIREYVQEGKKVVCKVLRVDQSRGHIDLSLRRVSENQRREKNAALKQELKAENLIDYLAKEAKKKPEEFYAQVAPPILEHYEYLHQAFEAIVEDEFSLSKTSIDKATAKRIEELVRERIKPKQVQVEGVFYITTYVEDGVRKVRETLVKARESAANSDIRYLGAGAYKITVTAEEYKEAEKHLKVAVDTVQDAFRKTPATEVRFERVEAK